MNRDGSILMFGILAVVDLAQANDPNASKFFEEEYQLDHLIGTLETPYVAIMDGITSK